MIDVHLYGAVFSSKQKVQRKLQMWAVLSTV